MYSRRSPGVQPRKSESEMFMHDVKEQEFPPLTSDEVITGIGAYLTLAHQIDALLAGSTEPVAPH